MTDTPRTNHGLSRRLFLATGVSGVVALAGCLGGDADVPDPVSLDEGQSCDNCNMVIDVHPGPAGQAYYLDDPPVDLSERDEGLAHFCSSWCTYIYTLEREEEQDVEPAGIYTTDYSTVDWQVFDDNGAQVISAHLEAEAFGDAAEQTYVVDSDVEGAMGASLVGFSDSDDAEAFADEYGGVLLDHDEITLEAVAGL